MNKSLSILMTAVIAGLVSCPFTAAAEESAEPAAAGQPAVSDAGSGEKVSKYPNSKLPMSTNMPVGSVYYDYIEKLDGMGYLKSMLYGARPYSRMDMARWTLEAREAIKKVRRMQNLPLNCILPVRK